MLRLHWRRVRSRYPWLQMVQTWRFWLLIAFTVTLLVYAIVSFKKSPVTYLEQEIKEIWLGNIEFDFQTGLHFLKEGKNVLLRGSMPDSQQLNGPPIHCGVYNVSKYLCASWYPKVKLEVENIVDEHASCQVLTWSTLLEDYQPNACFSLADFNWYGGSLLYDQKWPLNKVNVALQPYVTHDLKSYSGETNTVGNILDWFWISSSGVAIIVDNSYPVHISVNQSNDKLLCFSSKSENRPKLKYTICKSPNLRKIHRYVIGKYVHLPLSLPGDNYFTFPMWSTVPAFENALTQENLLKLCQGVQDHGLERNIVDINDNGLSVLKDNIFDPKKFSHSHQSLMIVRELKFETFLPVSPFVTINEDIKQKELDVFEDASGKPVIVKFQGDDALIMNLHDTKSADWYFGRIGELIKDFNVNGIHLVGGESDYLAYSGSSLNSVDIEKFLKHFVSQIAERFKLTIISTFAAKSQNIAQFIQLTSHSSSWESVGGLKSLIPSVLTLGILGYPFVIPNTIGGPGTMKVVNASYSEHEIPNRELYIRWMGISAHMPCMMFSFPPWSYDDEMVEIAKQFTQQHKDIVAPLVIKAAREYEISGSPIVRPLWWIDPQDVTSQTVDDEYLIGDTLLVAPVVTQGKMDRDIYIPKGKWKDTINDVEVEGPTWLRDYKVELNKVATFSMIKSTA